MDTKRTRDQFFQIVSSSEYKFYMKILETGLTESYLAILGLNSAKIDLKLTQNGQKHTNRHTEPVKTFVLLHMKSRKSFSI